MKIIKLLILGLLTTGALSLAPVSTTRAQDGVAQSLTFSVAVARDSSGNLIPGMQYEGYTCTRFRPHVEPEWTCTSLNDYDWFNDLPTTGTTVDFAYEFYMEGTGSAASCSQNDGINNFIIMIRQVAAPEGYKFSDGWNTFCQVQRQWIADGELIPNLFYPDSGLPARASLADSVKITRTETPSPHPNFPSLTSVNITFGGLFGATAEAKVDTTPVTEPTVEPATQPALNEPTLAETGLNASNSVIIGSTMIVLSIISALQLGKRGERLRRFL